MKLKNLIAVTLLATSFSLSSQSISPYLFGQNAWMPDTIGTKFYGGKLHSNWGKVKDSKCSVVRFGGIGLDNNKPTNYQYIKMIDSIRSKGMEPIIQVPYHKGVYSAQQAADIVQYINITKGRNIKYFIIGNEPDLDYSYTTASQVAAYIKPFASAMKAVDPSILIIGPETAWFNKTIIDGLTTPNGPNDITGRDGSGRYYIDVISFHYYPFNGSQTREDVINKLSNSGGLEDNLVYLNNRINNCNITHGRVGTNILKTAITEANVCYKNNINDNLYGTGVNSFVGAQFIMELFNTGAKNGVQTINMWSIIEGNNQELNIGYLDRLNGEKKPIYYHYQMMAEHFKGAYLSTSDNKSNVKVFASKDAQFIQVFILNQELSSNYNFSVRLNNGTIGGNSTLKINVQGNINKEYNGVINNQTTLLLTFNLNGELVKKTEYSITNQTPIVTTYSSTIGAGNNITNNINEIESKEFDIKVFPNPSNSKFNVELNKNNIELKYNIELFDLMGRLIYIKKSSFPERRQLIDLSGISLAEAVYIIKVSEEGDENNFKSTKVIIFK